MLEREFGLAESLRVIPELIPLAGAIRSVHQARGRENLTVIRKEGGGGPGDATNAGVNAARHPLICRADADSYLGLPPAACLVAAARNDHRHQGRQPPVGNQERPAGR